MRRRDGRRIATHDVANLRQQGRRTSVLACSEPFIRRRDWRRIATHGRSELAPARSTDKRPRLFGSTSLSSLSTL